MGRLVAVVGSLAGRRYSCRRDRWQFVRSPECWLGPEGAQPADPRDLPDGLDYVRPSTLLALLEGPEGSPDSRRAAVAVRRLIGPLVASGWPDRHMPGRWDARDIRRYAVPFGIGARRRARVEASPSLRNLLYDDAFRNDPPRGAAALVLPFSSWPADAARVASVCRGRRAFRSEKELACALNIPPEWVPEPDSGEDTAFCVVAHAAGSIADVMGGYDMLAGSRGRWREYLDGLVRASHRRLPGALRSAVPSERDVGTDAAGAIDPVRALGEQIVAPMLYRLGYGDLKVGVDRSGPPGGLTHLRIAARILYGDKGLPAILDLSGRWHARLAGYNPQNDAHARPWPVPFPELSTPDGIRLACLADARALADEGERLRHCVGGYAGQCRTGASVILSVRGAGDTPPSTVELRFRGGVPEVAQHRAMWNAAPPPEAVEAVEWLLSEVGAGRIDPDPAFLAHVALRRGSAAEIPAHWVDRGEILERIARWAPYLPRHARDEAGFAAAVHEAVRTRVAPLGHCGRAGMPAGRFLLARYPSAPPGSGRTRYGRLRAALAILGPTLAFSAIVALVRTHPAVTAAGMGRGGLARIARWAPTLLDLGLFAGWITTCIGLPSQLLGWGSDAGPTWWQVAILVGLLYVPPVLLNLALARLPPARIPDELPRP